MTKLNAKQQMLLNRFKAVAIESNRIMVFRTEVQTAKALERQGLIQLDCLEVRGRKQYEATVIDPRRKVVEDIQSYVVQLLAACKALSEEHDPNVLLNHMGEVLDKGRIETLRRALQERALDEFKEQGKI